MTQTPTQTESIAYYLSPPQACAYLPNQQAVMATIDPRIPLKQDLYSRLAQLGFRRSGSQAYRPQCPNCQACIPLRVIAADFRPNRSQRRCWQHNKDLKITAAANHFDKRHFALYRRYLHQQHRDGGMDQLNESDYLSFLTSPGIHTRFFEFHSDNKLLAVAVTDQLNDGLSAVYTFYDPDYSKRSLGVFTLLWQIEHCRQIGLEYLYLGFWISACRKMSYKNHYLPCQILTPEGWQQRNKNEFPGNPANN